MGAVSLGRMKVKDGAPALRQVSRSERPPLFVRRACAWGLEQITGERLPPLKPEPLEVWYRDWFLEPIGP
jgi:hypothetical protein